MRFHRYDPAFYRMRWWERVLLRKRYAFALWLGLLLSLMAGLRPPMLVLAIAFCVLGIGGMVLFLGTFYYAFRRGRHQPPTEPGS